MKILTLLFLSMLGVVAYAQTDTSTFRSYDRTFNVLGQTHKDVSWSTSPFQILIMEGDSLYNTLTLAQIENKLRSGDYKLNIINNRDSINKIMLNRIKTIFILEPKKPVKKLKQ